MSEYTFNPSTDEISKKGGNFDGGQLVRGGVELHYSRNSYTNGYQCVILATVYKDAVVEGVMQLKGVIECSFLDYKRHKAEGDQDDTVAFTISFS